MHPRKCVPFALWWRRRHVLQLLGLVWLSLFLPCSNHVDWLHSPRGYRVWLVCRPWAGSQSHGSLAQMWLNISIPTSLLQPEWLTQILSEPHASSSMAPSLALPWMWFSREPCGARQWASDSRGPIGGHVKDPSCLSKWRMKWWEVRKPPFHGRHWVTERDGWMGNKQDLPWSREASQAHTASQK